MGVHRGTFEGANIWPRALLLNEPLQPLPLIRHDAHAVAASDPGEPVQLQRNSDSSARTHTHTHTNCVCVCYTAHVAASSHLFTLITWLTR